MRALIAMSAAAVLCGCGGGGASDDPPAGGAASAEGFWSGSTSAGYEFGLLTLENGEFWGAYGRNGYIYGAGQGTGSWNGAQISGSGTDFYIAGGQVYNLSMSGTYTPKGTSSGTVTSGNGTHNFTAAYDGRYDQPALPFDLAGSWNLRTISPAGTATVPVTISALGTWSGTISGCSYSGTSTPRPSGKNVFNVIVSFSGSTCVFPGQTLTGVAVLLKDGASKSLTVMALLPNRSSGFMAMGNK
jgi:hypothetical protein